MEAFSQWEVFLAFSTIVSFIIMVFKGSRFFTGLESATKNLNDTIKSLKNEVKALGENNRESHKRLWDHNEEQDKRIEDHETRLTVIENRRKNDE